MTTFENLTPDKSSNNDVTPSTATIEQLLDAQGEAARAAQGFADAEMPYAPLGGEEPMVGHADQAQRLATIAPNIDLFIGYTADDAAPFMKLKYEARNQHSMAVLDNPAFRRDVDAMTNRVFAEPAATLVRDWTRCGGQAATYLVAWAPPGAPMGACHCIELPLLFATPAAWAKGSMLGPTPTEIDETFAQGMRRRWSEFAHCGAASLPSHLVVDHTM
ncbi:carboxylesterase family protein [Mycolicibacterium mageritense]|uniref:carboxylesterase family protein n=1 Tax=Mycolicibacterium mageritense TaxID=53462 RepID=UPI001E6381CC|nr:carboxylesterase family protein [Mycolicibacterium mageritense]GJJ22967.1 hypothetical protein MTY414_66400 [Mycolicibacterium mageritense]